MLIDQYDKAKLSPMMQQYIEIKKDYTDVIVFFRVGDFYEMFLDDALLASRELEITLTGKDAGVEERLPMCGIPFHAYEPYAFRLVEKGYKVAIVEQVEDPKTVTKGIVKRDVIKIITPGTINIGDLDGKSNNFIASVKEIGKEYVLAYTDVLTGESFLTLLVDLQEVTNELLNLRCHEVVVTSKFNKKAIDLWKNTYQIVVSIEDDKELPSYLGGLTTNLENEVECEAFAILINYVLKTQRENLTHLKTVSRYNNDQYLRIDMHSKRNLEITETLRLNQKNGSLLYLMDKCHTAMGSRMLHKWLNHPLLNENKINERLDYVEIFSADFMLRADLEEALKTVYDLERIVGKISCGTCNAKDLVQLRKSLSNIPHIKELLTNTANEKLIKLANEINPLTELYNLLVSALVDNPPFVIKEGGMFIPEYNQTLAELYEIKNHSAEWLSNYEQTEREATGIKNLKVGYNRVFGYYIEITKANLENQVLDKYDRKQTLANAERFITPELKEFETKVLSASDRIVALEYELFIDLKETCATHIKSIQELADVISRIDCLLNFANISLKNNYVRPTFNDKREVTIVNGRHPVVETVLKTGYVSNDVYINKYNTLLITGPNMSGKSTYMRMLALIAIMAQVGCYVPADSANLPIFDQIFTRIGASDDLLGGSSTFMVEMQEANYALQNATKNSLILFDEIGRGTATFDGLALAEAIIEYVHEKIGCATLFSTHYHELVKLEESLSRLKNVHVAAKEEQSRVVFLHKVLDGPIDKSYGINVAALAKLPKGVIARSKQILDALESENHAHNVSLDLFSFDVAEEEEVVVKSEVERILEETDVDALSPREALDLLYKLKTYTE